MEQFLSHFKSEPQQYFLYFTFVSAVIICVLFYELALFEYLTNHGASKWSRELQHRGENFSCAQAAIAKGGDNEKETKKQGF